MMDIRRSGYSRAGDRPGGRRRGRARDLGVTETEADLGEEEVTVRLRPATPAPPASPGRPSSPDHPAESHDNLGDAGKHYTGKDNPDKDDPDKDDTDKFVRPVSTDGIRILDGGGSRGSSIAVFGLACRYPDADDPA